MNQKRVRCSLILYVICGIYDFKIMQVISTYFLSLDKIFGTRINLQKIKKGGKLNAAGCVYARVLITHYRMSHKIMKIE